MIWGYTYAEKIERVHLEYRPHRHFLWLPTQLIDGRWAWLQKVWRYRPEYDPYERYYYSIEWPDSRNMCPAPAR